MYKFPRNIKIICFCLMAIGILSIAYGFIVADKNQYTDLEIRLAVKDLYNEYKSSKKLKFEQDKYDSKDSYKKSVRLAKKIVVRIESVFKRLHVDIFIYAFVFVFVLLICNRNNARTKYKRSV